MALKPSVHIENIPIDIVHVNTFSNWNTNETLHTTTRKYQQQQFGLTRRGHKELEQLFLTKIHTKSRLRETYFNKLAMLDSEWYLESYDLDRNQFLLSKPLFIVMNHHLIFHSMKKKKALVKVEEIVSCDVQRLECDFGNFSFEMDEITFPKGDPHFLCTIIYKEEDHSLTTDYIGITMCSNNVQYPVRRVLAEYFYRHERVYHDGLVYAGFLADSEYHISLTLRQIEEANKREDVKDIMSMVSGTYNQNQVMI